MGRFCKNCGAKLNAGSAFCSSCGTKLNSNTSPIEGDTSKVNLDKSTPSNEVKVSLVKNNKTDETIEQPSTEPQEFGSSHATTQENVPEQNDSTIQTRYVPDKTFEEMFLKKTGRLNRLRYFKRLLVLGTAQILFQLLWAVTFLAEWEETNPTFERFSVITGLVLLYPGYCLDVRRLQDMDSDTDFAYWIAGIGGLATISSSVFDGGKGMILAVIYLGISLYLLCASGTKGENKYGPDPLG